MLLQLDPNTIRTRVVMSITTSNTPYPLTPYCLSLHRCQGPLFGCVVPRRARGVKKGVHYIAFSVVTGEMRAPCPKHGIF
jgi:hypothetical protein